MRTYGQYCPVAKASEVLGDRWTLLIVSELIAGATRFNDMARGLPRISRPLLAQRLRSLERDGVVERRPGATPRSSSYHLTAAGEELGPLIKGFCRMGCQVGVRRASTGRAQPDPPALVDARPSEPRSASEPACRHTLRLPRRQRNLLVDPQSQRHLRVHPRPRLRSRCHRQRQPRRPLRSLARSHHAARGAGKRQGLCQWPADLHSRAPVMAGSGPDRLRGTSLVQVTAPSCCPP